MTKFEYLTGDLIASDEKVIAHGCNTQGVMGAGIAKQVKTTYPEVYGIYREMCEQDAFNIGSTLWVIVGTDENEHGFQSERYVCNLGTQSSPGRDASYWAVFLSFANLAEAMKAMTLDRVAIPRIACGLGGLKWNPVQDQISKAFGAAGANITVAVYDLPVQP